LTFESLWWPIRSQIEVIKIAFQSNSLLVHYIFVCIYWANPSEACIRLHQTCTRTNACIKIKAVKPQLLDVLNIAKQTKYWFCCRITRYFTNWNVLVCIYWGNPSEACILVIICAIFWHHFPSVIITVWDWIFLDRAVIVLHPTSNQPPCYSTDLVTKNILAWVQTTPNVYTD
jgi:hypothetical protein